MQKEYKNRWDSPLVNPAVIFNGYRVYWINSDYYCQEVFESVSAVEQYAKSQSFQYRIDTYYKSI